VGTENEGISAHSFSGNVKILHSLSLIISIYLFFYLSMLLSRTVRYLSLGSFFAAPLSLGLALTLPVQAQETLSPEMVEEIPAPDYTDPNSLRPLSQDGSLLSLQGGQRLMTQAEEAIDNGDYTVASQRLQEARQVFNQLSNFYQQLAGSFSGIDNRVADSQRVKALETAQMRDEATYQLSLVHRAQDQPELAVPLLIQVVRSQNPTTELGTKAYQQLFELGFVDAPYPSSGGDTSSN
jgi:hypothetical protein